MYSTDSNIDRQLLENEAHVFLCIQKASFIDLKYAAASCLSSISLDSI